MKRYWWVNHNRTLTFEINGGYLWSPKLEKNGAYSQFYRNMLIAAPGDEVVSFGKGVLAYFGTVTELAFSAPKPSEFSATRMSWAEEGWALPVAWRKLATPLRPKEILHEIGPLLPKKYSPINQATGCGHQKAYLAEINQSLFALLASRAELQNASFLGTPRTRTELLNALDDALQQTIQNDRSLGATEKEQLINARKGQGEFRQRVLLISPRCRITGLDNPALIRASHIKPWRSCSNSYERLDGFNGLALAPHVDHLFDRGLISFTDSGKVLVSRSLTSSDLDKLGLTGVRGKETGAFDPRYLSYLAFHRQLSGHWQDSSSQP